METNHFNYQCDSTYVFDQSDSTIYETIKLYKGPSQLQPRASDYMASADAINESDGCSFWGSLNYLFTGPSMHMENKLK